ncbi:MAG: isochorismatase family protein [Gaiellales bacterium]|nr:MAG: isochorismatase family protein [Gaiellales bacterium]
MGEPVTPEPGDALLIADVQNDFLPGGALGVQGGDQIIPVLSAYIARFQAKGLPIFLSRDWHPAGHCSFRGQGGPWPVHCVAGTPGSLPPPTFQPSPSAILIYKATTRDREAYSAFQDTGLEDHLRAARVRRLFIGGLATDYCVLNTVRDARRLGYDVCLLVDGIRAVNVDPDDGRKAEEEMIRLGAVRIRLESLAA